jgi:DNA polymerase-3 subunit delta
MASARPVGRATSPPADAVAYLVRGDDPSLVAQAVHQLVARLAGDHDPTLVVEEHGSVGADDLDAAGVVDALTTPPFLADRRIVVVRDAGRLGATEAGRLVECLDAPVLGVRAVFAAGGGTVPATLVKAIERSGAVVDTSLRSGRDRAQWLAEHLRAAPVRLNAAAAARLEEHLGGDVNRLSGLVDTLAAAYGVGATVDEAQLVPFLGEPGTVAPWDLTDAIDAGRTEEALAMLTRLLGPGEFHPLALLGILHRHYAAMLRLDGAEVATGEEAAALLGMRSAFPAKKALEQSRRLGSARVGRAVVLLAGADLDLRGRSALPGDVVLEVVVARLSRLAGARQGSGATAGRRRR